MEPIRVQPITGVLRFLSSGMQGPFEQWTEELPDITVDTSIPADTHIWETGINRERIEGKWVIVEQYPDREAAKVGHSKWAELMKEYPDFPLRDIDSWSLEEGHTNSEEF